MSGRPAKSSSKIDPLAILRVCCVPFVAGWDRRSPGLVSVSIGQGCRRHRILPAVSDGGVTILLGNVDMGDGGQMFWFIVCVLLCIGATVLAVLGTQARRREDKNPTDPTEGMGIWDHLSGNALRASN